MAAAAVGLAASVYLCATKWGHDPADILNALLVTAFSAWAGALVGGFLDWARHRRSPFEPLIKDRFQWYYRQRYWLRLALAFGFSWAAFVAIAVTVALLAGAAEEARPFFTLKGVILVLVFVLVFALEGAVIGAVVDLARHFAGTRDKKP